MVEKTSIMSSECIKVMMEIENTMEIATRQFQDEVC